jgi:hypothetical protein
MSNSTTRAQYDSGKTLLVRLAGACMFHVLKRNHIRTTTAARTESGGNRFIVISDTEEENSAFEKELPDAEVVISQSGARYEYVAHNLSACHCAN